MYYNLEAEIARKGILRRDLANVIGCSTGTVSLKLNGKSGFDLPQAKAIKRFLGSNLSLEYLFATDDEAS